MRRATFLLVAALGLISCDNIQPDRSDDDVLLAAAQTFFDQAALEPPPANARSGGSLDGLLDRFYPDWDQGEIVRGAEQRTAVVAVLGDDASVSFDDRGYILRTLIVEIDQGGQAISGQIVEFASPVESMVSDPRALTTGWLARAFGEAMVLVAEYDMAYAPKMAYLAVPNSEPISPK